MRIAVVEDSAREREALMAQVERYCRENGIDARLLPFGDGAEFLEARPEDIDLVLFDIEMARLNGMEAARRLRETDARVQIIFVTFMVQYAIEGYSVDAADFVAKPVSYPGLCAALDRAMRRIRFHAPRFLNTSYAKEPVTCLIQNILCVESINKKTVIHMADGQALYSSEPLYALEEKLSGEAFFRCHNAYLVNLGQVQTVGAAELMLPGMRVPVSKYRKKAFFQRLAACRGRLL